MNSLNKLVYTAQTAKSGNFKVAILSIVLLVVDGVTGYRKYNFNEFVAYILRDNMCMIIFDLHGCGGYQRPKTSYLGEHFGTQTQGSVHPTVPVLLTKCLSRNEISYAFQPPFSLLIVNSRTKPARLDFYLSIRK